MKELVFLISIIIFPSILLGQDKPLEKPERQPSTTSIPISKTNNKEGLVQSDSLEKPPITAYKIISIAGDTTFVDTSLTIQKDYKFNYLRKDNFELVPFSNVGQSYNSLSYRKTNNNLIPEFGAQARHFNFLKAEDILYYHVPTPLTELYFKTVPEQGQTLDAFFTVNTSERVNFSGAYKGLRSLGKYQNSLVSTGNFRATLSYATLNAKYRLNAHFVSQDLLNRENGGLDEQALGQYLSKEPEFDDRSLLEVKFENAENVLFGKRFFLDHQFDLIRNKSNLLTLEHLINFSDKKYIYRQDSPVDLYGDTFVNDNIRDEVKLRSIYNEAKLSFSNKTLGKLAVKSGVNYYNYRYNAVLFQEDSFIPDNLTGQIYSAGAEYAKYFGPLNFYGDFMVNVSGDYTGHDVLVGMGLKLNKNNFFTAEIKRNEAAPNFNYLLYQSDYINYNWYNEFENESSQGLTVILDSKNLVNIQAEYNQLNDVAYFKNNGEGVKPFQNTGTINYLKLKLNKEFQVGKFALDNTLMYQNVSQEENILNVPDFVTRNTLYYRDHWFKSALYLQTGFTLKYFTEYNMNTYDPVLAEFYVQNEKSFGAFPVVDFFFNAKVRQTRIFFKLEHVNALVNGNNNFSAPEHPYRDFLVRFGLVWNFFM